MAEPRSQRRNSNSQLLQELDALSQTMFPARRTASLVLPRSASPAFNALPPDPVPAPAPAADVNRPRSRRMSMSPFRARPKSSHHDDEDGGGGGQRHSLFSSDTAAGGEKKGIWGWKPMKALAHIRMQRLDCLFSVEVVAVQGLPASMNGLRLSVAVRKKESKDGAVQTMPARVLQGTADFEETLFIRCHVYCSGKQPPKFEPRPFLISAVAIDAPELDFGRSAVDLSLMVKESAERSSEGARVRQWDAAFPLAGKAKGGDLVVKLGFQIMEDGGVEIYKQPPKAAGGSSSSTARRQSKSSFSVSSPRVTRPEAEPTMTPSKDVGGVDMMVIDDFNLDEPGPSPPPPPPPPPASTPYEEFETSEQKQDDLDLPDFEVIDKGVEVQQEEDVVAADSESAAESGSASSEVVKEVVHDSAHLTRMTELDAIAQQIKALESMVAAGEEAKTADQEDQRLDADEETVTMEFLQMLELEEDSKEVNTEAPHLWLPAEAGAEEGADGEAKCLLSDLGKGLGPVVQTRDGGYLAAMNPSDAEVARKEAPRLAMQVSKPIILEDQKQLGSGIEAFQKLAAMGPEELGSKLNSLMPMDELTGKTAEQIAFEGIASAIISGRSREGASSSAAKSVAALKTMSSAMVDGRRERIQTGIWNVREEPVVLEEILPFSLQKIEAMAVEALKIQAGVAEEDPPFEVSPHAGKDGGSPLDTAISPEDRAKSPATVTMMVVIQLRDPLRRYETVGAPMLVLVQAAGAGGGTAGEEEGKYKVTGLHLGGMRMRMRTGARRSGWDGEKQRLTAMQWLVAHGMGKQGKRSRRAAARGGADTVWSMSSRVMADMWLKPMRNPDVKFPETP